MTGSVHGVVALFSQRVSYVKVLMITTAVSVKAMTSLFNGKHTNRPSPLYIKKITLLSSFGNTEHCSQLVTEVQINN